MQVMSSCKLVSVTVVALPRHVVVDIHALVVNVLPKQQRQPQRQQQQQQQQQQKQQQQQQQQQ